MGENDNRKTSQENKKEESSAVNSWHGKCIHIVLELAECGDVQGVSFHKFASPNFLYL